MIIRKAYIMVDNEEERQQADINRLYTAGNVESSEYRMAYNAKRDRAKYDDVAKRKAFKEEVYGDKKTITDPYTGKTLHKDGNAALNKYGDRYVNEHKSQTDHTIPLEKVVNQNKNNTFLKDEDIREIANIKENYKEIDAKLNQSKGSKSNIETAKKNNVGKQQQKKMTEEQINAQKAVNKKTGEITLKRANELGMEAAKSGAIMGGSISTVQNVSALMNGDEELPEAIFNIGVDTAKAAATSYGTSIAVKGAEGIMKEAGDKIIEKTEKTALKVIGEEIGGKLIALDAGTIGQIATITYEVGKSVQRYLKGDISPEELVNELGEKGVSMASSISCGLVGTEVGAVIGGLPGAVVGNIIGNMVGYFMGTKVYSSIQQFISSSAERDANIARYNRIAEQAAAYRKNLEKELDSINAQNRKIIKESFDGMAQAVLDNNVDDFTESLDDLCHLYGTEVQFKSREEFRDFWNNPDLMIEI